MKKAFASVTALVLAGSFAFAETVAQRTNQKSVAKPSSTTASKTRGRRVAEPVTGGQKAEEPVAPVEPKPETSTSSTAATTSEVPATPPATEIPTQQEVATTTPAPTVSDPIASLREQIDAESSGSERLKLQMKLADALLNSGKKPEALAELNSIASTEVFDPASYYNLGNALARLGETDGAINAYRKAIEQRNGSYSRAYNNLGVVLLRAGRWDEAYEALITALKLESFRYAEASYNLGRVYAARRQTDLAVREWRRALLVNPKHEAAALAITNVGSEGRVIVESQRADVPRQPTNVKASAKPLTVKTSLASSSKPLAIDQASFDFLQRARNAAERGNMVDAVDNFRRVISRQGGYFAPANLEISFALLNLKRFDEALASLLEVTNRDGGRYPISHFHLARVYELKGDLKVAEASFIKALEAHAPANSQFLLDVSRVREKQGDFKGALEVLERYVAATQQQGEKPSWSDERLSTLRQKAGVSPK